MTGTCLTAGNPQGHLARRSDRGPETGRENRPAQQEPAFFAYPSPFGSPGEKNFRDRLLFPRQES
ncbi:MAG: hypothetical protein D6736_12910 [Nitrospinota bacterium]|nr:MAG: hypothetical protein D6736_12910 [Nitrospinota bacterium]